MKQQLNKYLRAYLIITVIITNVFFGVNFAIAAGTQTSSLSKGLIAHFPLNRATMQSTTTFIDKTPNARIGTITPGASAGLVADQKGLPGGAYDFDGANTKIDTQSNWLPQSVMSISGWIYPESWGESTFGFILSNRDLTDNSFFLGINDSVAGKVNTLTAYAGAYATAADNAIILNKWTHFAITRTAAGRATFYINGVQSGAANQNCGTDTSGNNVLIGVRYDGLFNFDGRISDLRVYNRALSATEVKTLYKSYGSAVQSNTEYADRANLLGWWDMHNSGTSVPDKSNNGFTGTITNTASVLGKTGQALQFNGTGASPEAVDYNVKTAATTGLQGTTALTITARIKINAAPTAQGTILSKGVQSPTPSACIYNLLIDSSARLVMRVSNGTVTRTYTSGDGLSLNTWYNIVATWNGTTDTFVFYVNNLVLDGGKSGTAIATLNVLTAKIFEIGEDVATATHRYGFNGLIDDVKVYNVVWPPAKVAADYIKNNSNILQTNSLDKGLIAAFPLNRSTQQSATTFIDTTPYARVGTSANAIALAADQKGLTGGAMTFNGTTDTIPINNWTSFAEFQNALTISAWIKPNSIGEGLGAANWGTIVNKSTSVTGANGFSYNFASNGSLVIAVNGSGRYSDILTMGQWLHVVVTVDNYTRIATHYVNGVVSGVPGAVNPLTGITTTNPFTIGNRSTVADRTFDGQISDVRVWNRVLTAAEIKSLYKGTK